MRAITIRRRRRLAIGIACGLAATAFAFGVSLGDGARPPAPSPASLLTPGQLAGQRIVVGFAGSDPPAGLERMVRAGEVAGIVLFADNLPSREAGTRLVRRLQAIRRPRELRDPLLVMTDQEGGLVKRLPGAPAASAELMGERGAAFARAQGAATARDLRAVGIGVDLAPVLDVARPGGTIAESERGFGSTPEGVEAAAIPFAEGLRSGAVAATAKHFPGMGAASLNTDDAVQRIGLSKQTLRRVDEAPYRAFVAAGGELVMLSTAIYPAFSPRPAAFARPIATGELRDRLGFEGVSITDALDTVAVRAFGPPAVAGVAAVAAGADLLLYTDWREGALVQQALLRRLRSGSFSRPAFERAVGRVLRLRRELAAG